MWPEYDFGAVFIKEVVDHPVHEEDWNASILVTEGVRLSQHSHGKFDFVGRCFRQGERCRLW